MNIEALYSIFLTCNSVATDTRKIQPNALFFALKGDNYNANIFAQEALNKGAKYAVIDDEKYFKDDKTILVEDTLTALQQLANFHRKQLKTTLIALTGSNGKTTTKELINAVLSKKFKTSATVGNLNNHIGVPLTLLSLTKDTEIGIIEMGANHKKEIEFLCKIAEPNFGYITNFGKAHLEGFGGVEGVIEGKSELYHYIETNNELLFVNLDDKLQDEKTKKLKRYTFSTNSNSDVIISNIKADPMVQVTYKEQTINSNLIGIYNANNINVAITIGDYFSIESHLIKEAIENYTPTNNRSQLVKKGTNEIILDAYNANPSSMLAAIQNFLQLEHQNKTIIFGDMFELGSESIAEHKKIVDLLTETQNIQCFFIGNAFFANQILRKDFYFFSTFEQFSTSFQETLPINGLLLIKGSRGMALERTLELL